jgi:uncharacterized membrane protein YqjE
MKPMSNTNEPPPFSQLPKLLKTLSDEFSSFLDLKLKLFRREFWQEAQGLLSRTVGIAAAAVVTFAGFMVLIASLVLAVNIWLQNLLLSCLIVGGICFAGGAAVAVLLARRLSDVELPKTRIELDKDKQWIKAQTTQL